MAKGDRYYEGRRIKSTTIALGIGGQIKYDDMPPTPEARVEFTAAAKFENIKHKFNDDGTVDEILILTVENKSFDVTNITEPVPRPEQPELPTDDRPNTGPIIDAVKKLRGAKVKA